MKNRTIDLALIAGLVLVAGAIVWTLFSLGGTAPGSLPDAGPAASDGAGDPAGGGAGGPDGRGVVPVDPDGGVAGGDEAGGDEAGGGEAGGGAPGAGEADRQESLDGAASNRGVAPLAPGEAAADGDDASSETAGAAASGVDGGLDAAAGDPDASPRDGPDPQLPAARAPPVPESGPVELGRIGFSFVTGGEGACGIVLEPWTHVAASRELLEAYGCGAEVTVTLDDPTDGRTEVEATIADTMNPSFSRTVNIYVGQDEPALAYGLTTGTISPR